MYSKTHIFLTILILFEWFLIGPFQSFAGPYISPVILTAVSALVATIAIGLSFPKLPSEKKEKSHYLSLWPSLFWMPVLLYVAWSVFSVHPVDHNYSDVFAQVLYPSEWLLKGDYPYQEVRLPTYTMHNTYLPMQWLPFTIPVYWGFDPRWIPVTFWAMALCVFIVMTKINFSRHTAIIYVLTLSVIVAGLSGYMTKNPKEYSATLELLPAAYYIMLIFFLWRGSWWGIGLFMGFCLLSRFSIVLFIPFLVFYVWMKYGMTFFLKSAAMTISVILLLFVLPFMSQDIYLPKKIVANYDNGAAGEWRVHDWQNEGDLPYQLSRGTGVAIYFRDRFQDNLLNGVRVLKKWGFGLSVLTGLLLLYVFLRLRNKISDDKMYMLGAMKLYLTVFYTFVLIPYTYLYIIPLTISVLILFISYQKYADHIQVSTNT
jgi:hypothetical protein